MHRNAIVLCLLFASVVSAHDITPEDYFSLATITDFAVSPDGKHVAYCEARWDKDANDRKADLWVVATEGQSKPKRLTFDRANDRHPRWSADGMIYFVGNRKRSGEKAPYDGKSQVWCILPSGGEPKAITRTEGGVSHFDLAPKANALVYSINTKKNDDDDFAKLRKEFGKLDYGHGVRQVSEVRRLDLDSWREQTIVNEGKYVQELVVTQDGKRIAMIAAKDDSVIESEGRSNVVVWDVTTGKVTPTDETWRTKSASPYPWLGSLAWSHDGARLAYCAIYDAYPAEIVVNEEANGKWSAHVMPRPEGWHVRGYGTPLRFNEFGGLIYLGERAGRVSSFGYNVAKRATDPEGLQEKGVVQGSDRGGKTTVILRGSHDRMPELYIESSEKQLTNSNPHVKDWKLPSVKHLSWKAPDGASVGGVLELPAGHKAGTKLPLVVAIHGGPTTATYNDLRFDPHNGRLYFAARGYAVLCPNYRGSTGYGDKFVTDLISNENDVDVKDILAGIQHLVKEGIVDPQRVAVMGWSNGGYLTNCLITLKDSPVKIKAASSGAGILDTVAEWGFNDEPAYPFVFKKGTPWEQPDVYKKTSPTYGLGNVTTPTLIHVGANDERCPPGHSRMLYRALKEYKKVPTELVVYPGEPHGLGKYDSRLAKMKWDLAWFDKYVQGKK